MTIRDLEKAYNKAWNDFSYRKSDKNMKALSETKLAYHNILAELRPLTEEQRKRMVKIANTIGHSFTFNGHTINPD